MPKLLMISPAPVIDRGTTAILDVKFAEGMAAQAAAWDGRIDSLLWEGAATIAFPVEVEKASLPWRLITLPKGQALSPEIGKGYDLISAAGDMPETLELARPGWPAIVYTIEYSHRTRLDILDLDHSIGPLRKLRRRLWLEKVERRRRSAFAVAAALQSNGYPGQVAYGGLAQDLHLYLDNRMTPDRYANDVELQARSARLSSIEPLRLVYSGRLDPMKGAQDLVPLAKALTELGFPFEFDVFGDGSLYPQIVTEIAAAGLADRVHMHGNVDFASELIPWQRRNADLFVSCHRQGDPSCTYIESMGCGLPIVGYDNEMWGPLSRASGGGWAEPIGRVDALAARIAKSPRSEFSRAATAAYEFARKHDFETEFLGRMNHLKRVAARLRRSADVMDQ